MTDETKNNQVEQRKLLEEALKQPGVADAVAAFGRLGQYGLPGTHPLVNSGYAAGGNA